MFSFHKPKIYRSNLGCCICRAKSSSSRFTDSKKYEPEFERCFRITEKRSGEICNACVLLVKRWKKLPTGTNRNWHHVVDARAGPGTKSFKNKPIGGRGSGGKKRTGAISAASRNLCGKDSKVRHQSMTSSESETDGDDVDEDDDDDDVDVDEDDEMIDDILVPMDPVNRSTNIGNDLAQANKLTANSIISSNSNSNSSNGSLRRSTRLNASTLASDKMRLHSHYRGLYHHHHNQYHLHHPHHHHQYHSYNDQYNQFDDSSANRNSRATNNTDRNNNLNAGTRGRGGAGAAGGGGGAARSNQKRRLHLAEHFFSLLDTTFWKKEKVCCGIIFKGPNNEVIIYPKLLRPCACRQQMFSSNVSAKSQAAIIGAKSSSSDQTANNNNNNVPPPPQQTTANTTIATTTATTGATKATTGATSDHKIVLSSSGVQHQISSLPISLPNDHHNNDDAIPPLIVSTAKTLRHQDSFASTGTSVSFDTGSEIGAQDDDLAEDDQSSGVSSMDANSILPDYGELSDERMSPGRCDRLIIDHNRDDDDDEDDDDDDDEGDDSSCDNGGANRVKGRRGNSGSSCGTSIATCDAFSHHDMKMATVDRLKSTRKLGPGIGPATSAAAAATVM